MADQPLTPAQLTDLLSQILAGATGSPERVWRKLIEVEKLNIAINPHTNWTLVPKGKAKEVEAIIKAAAVVREAHPYVDW